VSTTLYVSNLPFAATEELLASKFGKFGTVISVRINRDAATGITRRSGYVEMATAAEADSAVSWLNLADFDGRVMSVNRTLTAVPTPARMQQ
jgi:RNA recognition motif-containing protein